VRKTGFFGGICLFFPVVLFHPVAAQAQAQAPLPVEFRARHASIPPKLDGVLDDAIWQTSAIPIDGWVTYNPLRGGRAEEETTVWVAYDAEAIYFAFQCRDTQASRIRTTITRRDNAWSDDWVGLSLDSTRAGQLAYHLFVNPSGIQMDGLNSGSNGEDMAPDWVWQSAGHVEADGWSAEIRVPLEMIRFRSGSDVRMGVLFWRRLSRSGVSVSWPELLPGRWVFESHASLVFDELRQRRLLEVIPSATFSSNQVRATETAWYPNRSRGNLGASLKYGITSTVTLDATVNPDFSQVESDAFEVEVNQRFPVFFSEKRPFFMEGLGLFNLAGTNGDATMRTAVHTRRIIDPSAGLKVTGAAGKHTFGVLSSADASPEGDHRRAFTIGRDVRNFGDGRYVGVLVTDTEFESEFNRVIAGDFNYRRGQAFRLNGAFLNSNSRDLEDGSKHGVGATLSYSYNTRRLNITGQGEHYDEGFQMDTAFINRVGVTRGWQYQEVQFYPDRPSYTWIKRVAPFFWVTTANDLIQGGGEAFYLPGIRFNFTRAGFLRVDHGRGHETFAGQRFETGRTLVDGGVQLTRWLSLGGNINRGPAIFYDEDDPFQGDQRLAGVRIGLQPNAKLSHNLNYNYASFDRRSTGENEYTVHVLNLRNVYQFSPRFFIRGIAQFDSSRERVLLDLLASYELAPGTVVHAGYGSLVAGKLEYEDDDLEDLEFSRYLPTARAFFFKASYLVRFGWRQ
jgi:hypothetical protein